MADMEFKKYKELGAYHLNGVFPSKENSIRRFNPWLSAIYEIPAILAREAFGVRLESGFGADIGCGEGCFVAKTLVSGGKIVGVDYSFDAVALGTAELRKRINREARLLRANAAELPFKDGRFDYAVSLEVVEHMKDDASYLAEIARITKRDGVVVISTPQRSEDGVLADPYHIREYSPDEFKRLLAKYFKEVRVYGFIPNSLYGAYCKNLLVRVSLKFIGSKLYNPFVKLYALDSFRGYRNLIAVCKR